MKTNKKQNKTMSENKEKYQLNEEMSRYIANNLKEGDIAPNPTVEAYTTEDGLKLKLKVNTHSEANTTLSDEQLAERIQSVIYIRPEEHKDRPYKWEGLHHVTLFRDVVWPM